MWGTVGSGLTPGSRPDGRWPEIPENSGKKSGKTGKFRKIQKFARDLSNESYWQADSRGQIKIPEFWKIPGIFWKHLKKL